METGINQVQFPTITICANQINSKWNLARILLNQRLVEDFIKAGEYDAITEVFARLTSSEWVNSDILVNS